MKFDYYLGTLGNYLYYEVVTTGATVNEVSRQLKHAGARDVVVWCIARTVK